MSNLIERNRHKITEGATYLLIELGITKQKVVIDFIKHHQHDIEKGTIDLFLEIKKSRLKVPIDFVKNDQQQIMELGISKQKVWDRKDRFMKHNQREIEKGRFDLFLEFGITKRKVAQLKVLDGKGTVEGEIVGNVRPNVQAITGALLGEDAY